MEHLTGRQKTVVMIAIMAATLFVGLNTTIVNTALPRIVATLGGMDYFSWIFTTFMLASSVTAILVGKLSDIYGRKPFILTGIAVFITGSLFAGLAANMLQLIVCRGIQGLGGGMIMSTSFAAVGDLFVPRERARWQGLMGAVFGVTSVLGPAVGGYIVDYADWHWIFWIFIPFGVMAFLLIFKMFPHVSRKEPEEIDFLGSLLLTAFMISLLLTFTWGGSKYPWLSGEITGLFSFAILMLGCFLTVEKRVKSPVLPLELFQNKIFAVSNLVGFFMGIGMFSTIMYMPFFVQGVLGASATISGFVVMPITLTTMITSAVIGQIVSRTGKYKKLALMGLAMMAAGIFMTALMNRHSALSTGVFAIAVIGIGLGICLPIFTLTTQNAVEHRHLGVATATFQLFRQFGGTIGVALLSIIMNYRFQGQLDLFFSQAGVANLWQQEKEAAGVLAAMENPQILMNPGELAYLQAALPMYLETSFIETIEILRSAFSYALAGVFMMEGILVLIGLLIGLLLEEIDLRTSKD